MLIVFKYQKSHLNGAWYLNQRDIFNNKYINCGRIWHVRTLVVNALE
jgi:hypothetical protein